MPTLRGVRGWHVLTSPQVLAAPHPDKCTGWLLVSTGSEPRHTRKDSNSRHGEGVWGVRGYLKTLAWYKKDKTPVGRNRVSGNEEGNERADREKHVHRERMERAAGVGEILLRGRLRCFNPWMAAEPSGEGVGRRLSLSICLPE